jgi:hypothetical protein
MEPLLADKVHATYERRRQDIVEIANTPCQASRKVSCQKEGVKCFARKALRSLLFTRDSEARSRDGDVSLNILAPYSFQTLLLIYRVSDRIETALQGFARQVELQNLIAHCSRL